MLHEFTQNIQSRSFLTNVLNLASKLFVYEKLASFFLLLITIQILHLYKTAFCNANLFEQHAIINRDRSKSIVSVGGRKPPSLIDTDDVYFEILYPDDIRYTYQTRMARGFGSSFNDLFNNALLVPVKPFDGCGNILNSRELRNNIAFVIRGECSFLSKALNVENAGALAIIISDNDKNSEALIEMIGDETDRVVTIPAVFLRWKDGYMIKRSIESHHIKAAKINIPLNTTYKRVESLRKAPWAYY